jgi:hypothetical protein
MKKSISIISLSLLAGFSTDPEWTQLCRLAALLVTPPAEKIFLIK